MLNLKLCDQHMTLSISDIQGELVTWCLPFCNALLYPFSLQITPIPGTKNQWIHQESEAIFECTYSRPAAVQDRSISPALISVKRNLSFNEPEYNM